MLVTIFTDAGYCPESHIGTWAVWAKSERGVTRAGGVFRDGKGNSTHSEADAVVNGIHAALANGVAMEGDAILVQCDNQGAETFLRGKVLPKHTCKNVRPKSREAYAKLIYKYKLSVRFRHVKGHSGTKDKRSAVNTWCDQVCTFFLKMARHEKKPEKWKKPGMEAPYGIKITGENKNDPHHAGP